MILFHPPESNDVKHFRIHLKFYSITQQKTSWNGKVISQKTIFSDISILTELADMTIAALVATFVANKNLSCKALLKNITSTINKRVKFSRVICFW